MKKLQQSEKHTKNVLRREEKELFKNIMGKSGKANDGSAPDKEVTVSAKPATSINGNGITTPGDITLELNANSGLDTTGKKLISTTPAKPAIGSETDRMMMQAADEEPGIAKGISAFNSQTKPTMLPSSQAPKTMDEQAKPVSGSVEMVPQTAIVEEKKDAPSDVPDLFKDGR